MKFQASAEVHNPADQGLMRAHRRVVPFLSKALSGSNLRDLDATLTYVPIVMPESMHDRYPARSRLRKKQRVYECCPTLNYDIFVGGDLDAQLEEYLRGIALSIPYLADLGASNDQIREFEQIIIGAKERILGEQPEQPTA